MVPVEAENLTDTAMDMIRDHAMDLVAASLAKLTDGEVPRVSSSHALTLTRLRAAVEARLGDPSVDAESIATAAGVSVRYANEVLAEHGASLMRLVKTRRLERCRRALEDPLQAHRTISDIAYSWGFSDMTHFGRVFRAAYGLLPKDHRIRFKT
jgi:AraC-like DNA-binding protein